MKGTYCLLIELKKDSKIKIGEKLGYINFNKAYYIYVGSGMSSLESRIKRHLSSSKKKHWHIDYLLLNKNTKINEVLFNISNSKIECEIANFLNSKGDNILNFGSSDCSCNSHLIYFNSYDESLIEIKNAFNKLKKDFYNLNYLKEYF